MYRYFTLDLGGMAVIFRLSVDIGRILNWSSKTKHFLHEDNDSKNLKNKQVLCQFENRSNQDNTHCRQQKKKAISLTRASLDPRV